MTERKKITIQELIERQRANTLAEHLDIPDGYTLDVEIDKGRATFSFHPGWDDDGEERDDDPIYIDIEPRDGPSQIEVLLGLLGIKSHHA